MTSAPTDRIAPERAETLCGDGIDVVELMCAGEEPEAVLAAYPAADVVDGLVLYVTLLETTISVLNAAARRVTSPADIRAAARESAKRWRTAQETP